MNLESTKKIIKQYLLSIGVNERFINEQFNNRFTDSLVLRLPDVCIIKPNRLHGGSSNQTHIHCTGDDMLFFYDEYTLRTVTSSTDDERVKVMLLDANLTHLEAIKNARRDKEKEGIFFIDREISIVSGSTVKKISKRTNQSPQVQISKIRMDDLQFTRLRLNLFSDDRLVFLKYGDEENKYLVIGIPSTFENENNISNVKNGEGINTETEDYVNETNNVYLENRETSLRGVDIYSIAKYAPEDEKDETDDEEYTFDLSKGIETRKKRTERHANIVKLVAQILSDKRFNLFEGRIDCLGIRQDSDSIICEVKTLDGSKSDECSQVMKAFSQLFYYEKFHMGQFKGGHTQKVVIFENKISDEHIMFFEQNDILVFWVENEILSGTSTSVEYLCNLEII